MKRTRFVVAVFLIGIIVILGGWLLGIIGRDDGRTLGERLDAAYHAYMPMSGTKPLYIRQLVGPDMARNELFYGKQLNLKQMLWLSIN